MNTPAESYEQNPPDVLVSASRLIELCFSDDVTMTPRSLLRYAHDGEIPCVRIGSKILFNPQSFVKQLEGVDTK